MCATAGNCQSGFGSVGVLINTTPSQYKASVQQPINSDGSSIFKANRGVIPVKFGLTQNDTSTCELPAATIAVTRTAGGHWVQLMKTRTAWRRTAAQISVFLAASTSTISRRHSLGVGTYRVDISINGIVVGQASVSAQVKADETSFVNCCCHAEA